MFKRTFWFSAGLCVGATGTVVGYLRAREAARRHVPESVQDAAERAARLADAEVRHLGRRARVVARDVRVATDDWLAAADEGRRTRRHAEVVLRRELDQAGL